MLSTILRSAESLSMNMRRGTPHSQKNLVVASVNSLLELARETCMFTADVTGQVKARNQILKSLDPRVSLGKAKVYENSTFIVCVLSQTGVTL